MDKRKYHKWCYLFFMTLMSIQSTTYAWYDHFLITYSALSHFAPIIHAPTVAAEPLEDFLRQEQKGLTQLLIDNEKWARGKLPYYPPLPDHLVFHPNQDSTMLIQNFLQSLRVNPLVKLKLYIQTMPPVIPRISHGTPLKVKDVSLAPEVEYTSIGSVFDAVYSGTRLSPLQVISTASNEPDFGLDMQLWENNGTSFAKLYQWGQQPFGNPYVSYGTQSPFHMAFWYESKLIYGFAPYIHRTYPDYRLHTYLSLAQYAFATHHPYWGWRFLGWALHYAQDLSQPYHSTLAPGENIAKLMLVAILDRLGVHHPDETLKQRLINRHLALENYAYFALKYAVLQKDHHHLLRNALQNTADDHLPIRFDADTDLHEVIAARSHQEANAIDEIVGKTFPKKYIADPAYNFSVTEPDINMLKVLGFEQADAHTPLNLLLAKLFHAMGVDTRIICDKNSALSH